MRILLVRLRQIGDVVFTTPAIRALRRALSRRAPHLSRRAGRRAGRRRQPASRRGDRRAARRGVAGLRDDLALGRRLRAARFDLAIDFHGGPRASLLTWLSGAPTRIGYDVAGRSWMYTTPRRAAARAAAAALGREPVGPAGAARHRAARSGARIPVEMPVDAGARRGGRRAAGARRRRAATIALDRRPRQRRQSVPALAGRRRSSTLVAALAARDPRRRVIVTSGPSERDAAERVIAGARARLPPADARSRARRAATSRSPSCARSSIAPRCTSAATAARCTSRRRARVPIVGAVRPDAAGAVGAVARPATASPKRSKCRTSPCRPCDQRVCAPGDFRCLTRIAPDAGDRRRRARARAAREHADVEALPMTLTP